MSSSISHPEEMMKFGEKLTRLRKEKKITQEEAARAIGVTRRTYCSYENDGRYPRSREGYKKLAGLFGVDPNYLLAEDEGFVADAGERYGSRGRRQAEELVADLTGLFAGGSFADEDLDVMMEALQKSYWIAKEKNRKYTPKKYRPDGDTYAGEH